MKIYTLAGISKRGKQIVKQCGARWECIGQRDKVLFSDRPGPWLYIVPLDERRIDETAREARDESKSRWVHALNDDDFKVMP